MLYGIIGGLALVAIIALYSAVKVGKISDLEAGMQTLAQASGAILNDTAALKKQLADVNAGIADLPKNVEARLAPRFAGFDSKLDETKAAAIAAQRAANGSVASLRKELNKLAANQSAQQPAQVANATTTTTMSAADEARILARLQQLSVGTSPNPVRIEVALSGDIGIRQYKRK